jgi:hypothetical protein
MKPAYFLLIILATISCKEKKDDVVPVIVNKTITVIFSQYSFSQPCASGTKYPGVIVAITHATDTLYLDTTDVNGRVVFTDIIPMQNEYYTLKYTTPAPTPRTGSDPIYTGSNCLERAYGPSGQTNVSVEYK